MGKKKVTPEQADAIEILIAEQLSLGNADMAANLAESLDRRLTTIEIDSLVEFYMAQQCPEIHLCKMADIAMYGASLPVYEKVINFAAQHGHLYIMYNMSASCGRNAVQSEIDLVYLHALNDVSPTDFAKSVKYCLSFGTMKKFPFSADPSKLVSEKVLRRLIDDSEIEIASSLVWHLFLRNKEQVCQDLIDELVPLMYKNMRGWSFFVPSNNSDVIRLASVSVIETLLDDYLTKSHEALRLFEYASCDKTGRLTSKVVDILIEDAKNIADVFKKPSFIRSIVQILLNSVYKVVTTVETANTLALFCLEEGLWAPAYSLANYFNLDKATADKVTEALIEIKLEKDTDEYILDMYRRYGATDNVRDLLIKSFSANVFYNRRLKESVNILAELGGTPTLDFLTLDLLSQIRDSFAVDVAKHKLVSPHVREKVIERAIGSFSSLDFVLPLVKLNKRGLKNKEILSMLQLNIDALRTQKGRLDAYAGCALELLKYKASLALAPDLLFALKERGLTSCYVEASIMTGVKIE